LQSFFKEIVYLLHSSVLFQEYLIQFSYLLVFTLFASACAGSSSSVAQCQQFNSYFEAMFGICFHLWSSIW